MKRKKAFITISLLIFALLTCIIDAIVKPNYFLKITFKILIFIAIPISFFIINKDDTKEFKKLFELKNKGILKSLLIGLGIYISIVSFYFLTKNFIDFSNVTKTLTNNMGITANNFIYVSLYISLLNSFLEEFLFRGYGFITLKKYSSRSFAYIYSSSIFAIYHIGMLLGMFNLPTLILLLIGLIIGGFIFNYLNEKNENIYTSWFAHMFTNFGINTIGFILFNII